MDILDRATSRRAFLQDRRRRLLAQLEGVDAELRDLEGFFKVAASLQDGPPKPPFGGSRFPDPAKAWPFPGTASIGTEINPLTVAHGSKTRYIVNSARKIIKQHGALPARRILQMLDDQGLGSVLIPGKDEKGRVSYLSAVLSKDDRFASDRDAGGYILVEAEEKAPQGGNQEGLNISSGDDLI